MINSKDDLPSCDHLHIGFDYSKEKDLACLSVLRKKGRGMEVISTFYGEEAEWMYARLSNGPSDRAPQFIRSDMFKKISSGEIPVCKELSDIMAKNPSLMQKMEDRFNRMGQTSEIEPFIFTMPKGIGRSEATENFKRYMNELWGLPVATSELGMMTYEAFEASYKCKIFVLSDNNDSKLEVRFDFGEGKVMVFPVTETDLYALSPRQIQHKTCAQALELLYKEEKK